MNKKLKNIVRQIHLWLGLITGLIVFVISVTGCIFVFEEEIRDYTQKDYLYVPVQQKPFIGLERIIENFEKKESGSAISGIRIINKEPNATVSITSTKKKVYYFNPYDGSLVKKTGRDWLSTVQLIHTSLLLGETGKTITGFSVLIFLVMLITGLILWFPNQLRLLKQSLSIKWKASFKRVNYDLHNVLGFYASWILIIIASSGLYFAFKEVKTVASFFTGTTLSEGKKQVSAKPSVVAAPAVRYDQMFKEASLKYPGANTTSFSIRKNGALRLRLLYPYQWARKQNTLNFDAETGQLLKAKLYKDFNGADLIEATNYDLHTGRLFGITGKIIAFLASLIAASLPVTGFIIWYKKKWKSGRNKAPRSRKYLTRYGKKDTTLAVDSF